MKYYTPKIEEFHVGFECEVLLKDTWEKGICKIVSNEMSEGCIEQLEVAYNWIRDDGKVFEYSVNPYEVDSRWLREFRVKCLDKQDIESLNFTDYRHSTNDWYKMIVDFSIGNIPFKAIRLSHNYDDNIISIMGYEYISQMENAIEETQLFYGKINNISEFKILLKQLNVL